MKWRSGVAIRRDLSASRFMLARMLGSTNVAVLTSVVLVAAVALAGCGQERGPVATIHVSVPLSGPLAKRGADMKRAVELALVQSGNAEGGRNLKLVIADSAKPADGAKAGADAVEDKRSLALISGSGTGEEFEATTETRPADLLQVAPIGGPGLDSAGYEELLPAGLQSGEASRVWRSNPRNLVYLAPSEFMLGRAIMQAAAADGSKQIEWWSDNMQKTVLEGMRVESESAGMKVIESDGGMCPMPGVTDVRALEAAGQPRAMAAILCTDKPSFLEADSPSGVEDPPPWNKRKLVTPALAYEDLPPAGQRFFEQFRDRYGHWPDRWAIFSYEAAGFTLQAIDNASENTEAAITRQDVRDAAFAVKDRFGPTGHYDVLSTGETTLNTFAVRMLPLPEDPTKARPPTADSVIEMAR